MHIISLNNYPNKGFIQYQKTPQKTNFKGCCRDYMDYTLAHCNQTGGLISTYTQIFRRDFDWKRFVEILDENFKDYKTVNLYSLACSDGSEAYTTAISVMENSNNPEKFTKILATDRDDKIIEFAQKRRINLTEHEEKILLENSKKQQYFGDKKEPALLEGEPKATFIRHSFEPNDELKSKIDFKCEDILTTLSKLEDKGNSAILCRNVFPYLSIEAQVDVYKMLLKKLKPGSLFVLGQFDKNSELFKLIQKSGFQKLESFIFRRI